MWGGGTHGAVYAPEGQARLYLRLHPYLVLAFLYPAQFLHIKTLPEGALGWLSWWSVTPDLGVMSSSLRLGIEFT